MLLAEHVKHLGLLHKGAQLSRTLRVGQAQEKAATISHQVKQSQLTGFDEQGAIEIVGRVVERIIGGVERAKTLEQTHLVVESVGLETGNGFVGGAGDAMERQVGVDNLVHSGLKVADHLVGDATVDVQFTIITVGHRRVYP